MKTQKRKKKASDTKYYDKHGVLGEMVAEDIALSLDEALKAGIVSGNRKRKLRNITIKIDPLNDIRSYLRCISCKGSR